MKEPEEAAQAVSHMKLTFPKRIFEVGHLMKQESTAEFLTQDAATGEFTKHIQLLRLNDDNVSICLTVDNLVFEANNLCFYVDKVQAKDEAAIEAVLERQQPSSSSSTTTEAAGLAAATLSADGINDDKVATAISNQQNGDREMSPAEQAKDHSDQGNIFTSSSTTSTSLADDLAENAQGSMENAQEKDSISDVHVVVEKHSTKRPVRPVRLKPKGKNEDSADAKQNSSKGKKRPHYKREANIECKICHHMYKDELSLISHVQKIHGDSECNRQYIAELKEMAKVACKICGKILGNKRNEISSHMLRVHGKDDDFISRCDECGAEFRRSFLLKEHIRRQHPKHERVLCHLCPASFKLKEYLTEHLKYTHNKQFKWQCNICGKMTSSPKNLRRHKKLHDGLSYQCPICNKLFSEAGNMKRHILYVHNSQTVAKCRCPHCHKDLSTKNNLLQHINLVHMKTTPFYCDICKKYFARKKLLIEHAAMMHPGVPILSTTKNDQVLGGQVEASSLPPMATSADNVLSDDQQAFAALAGVEGGDEQSTIIIKGPDGTEHVIMAPQNLEGQNITVTELGHGLGDRGEEVEDELVQPAHNINIMGDVAGALGENSLSSLAQQALAAFEAGGGLETAEFGSEQYLSVIGEDGQEIRVQIVRKDPSDVQPEQQLEDIYVQAALAVPGEIGQQSTEGEGHSGGAGHMEVEEGETVVEPSEDDSTNMETGS